MRGGRCDVTMDEALGEVLSLSPVNRNESKKGRAKEGAMVRSVVSQHGPMVSPNRVRQTHQRRQDRGRETCS